MKQPGRAAPQAKRRQGDTGGPLVVDPSWLLKAAAAALAFALLCGYATYCLLFYQGQWQLVLRPVQTPDHPATIGGAAVQVVRFGTDASGAPQRSAWWLPASEGARYRHLTLLFLPSGEGSLLEAVPTLTALQTLGVSIFAVDYRGYGASAAGHPTEERMRADAEAAWDYLVGERRLEQARILPFGVGLGASLATTLAVQHNAIPAVLLDTPRFHVLEEVQADPRTRFLPVDLLLHDRFELGPELRNLRTPKLILTRGVVEDNDALTAADPKMTVSLPAKDDAALMAALRRFLDLYGPPTPAQPLSLGVAPGDNSKP